MLFIATDKFGDSTPWQGVLPGWEEPMGYRSVTDMFQVKFQVTTPQADEIVRFYREFSGNAIGGLAEACKQMAIWMTNNIDPSVGMGIEPIVPEEVVEDANDDEESES